MLIPLTLPPGFSAYGASEADPVLSADGPTFWGMDVAYNKVWYGYAVWKQSAPGVPAAKVAELPGAGQGRLSLQGDGRLYASAYPKLGDSTTTVVVVVPGFVPFAAQPVAANDSTARAQAAAAVQAAQAAQKTADDVRTKLRQI
jgi:hypothetical protein